MLWNRRRETRERLDRFFARLPTLSEGEEEDSYLHLFLMTDPLGDRGHHSRLTFDDFAGIMQRTEPSDGPATIRFDHVYPTANGYVARHVVNNDPQRMALTWTYLRNCSSVVSMPIRSASTQDAVANMLEGYPHGRQFIAAQDRQRLWRQPVLDATQIYLLLLCVLSKDRSLRAAELLLSMTVFAKAVLDGVWRRLPFVDTPGFVKQIGDYGIPVIQANRQVVPGVDPMALLELRPIKDPPDQVIYADQWANATLLFTALASALGILHRIEEGADFALELIAMVNRLGASTRPST
jgi:hypothetical protein